jgi:hypothetical protein
VQTIAGEFWMAAQREIDADQAVRDVLNAWGSLRTSAKNFADNSRARHKLTEQEAGDERATKKVFLDAYRAFYEDIKDS